MVVVVVVVESSETQSSGVERSGTSAKASSGVRTGFISIPHFIQSALTATMITELMEAMLL